MREVQRLEKELVIAIWHVLRDQAPYLDLGPDHHTEPAAHSLITVGVSCLDRVETPEEAWGLPAVLEQKSFDPEIHISYRFPSLTRALVDRLETHRIQDKEWAERLARLSPLRRLPPQPGE